MRHKQYGKRIEFHERDYTTDKLGDKFRSGTSLVKTVWASVVPARREKTVQYDQVPLEGVIEIKMHQPKTWSVDKNYLIKHDGVFYSIVSVISGERKMELKIEAKRYD